MHFSSFWCFVILHELIIYLGASLVAQSVKNHLQGRRCGFNPRVRKISWRRAWWPIPGFLPGESHGLRSLAGYKPTGSQKVGHDWSDWAYIVYLDDRFLVTPQIRYLKQVSHSSHSGPSPAWPFLKSVLGTGLCLWLQRSYLNLSCMCVYMLPCSELDKANVKYDSFFWSLHAVCIRLFRKILARKASLWIYRLSDTQRSGGKIMLPPESELRHQPRVRNRRETKGQSLPDFISHLTSNSPGEHHVYLHFHFEAEVFICLHVLTQLLPSSSFCFSSP